MVHISDIAARTMGIGYGGDRQIPLLDPYAQRLRKRVDETIRKNAEIAAEIDSIPGRWESRKRKLHFGAAVT